MRVAIDATPLLGHRSGIGQSPAGPLTGLREHDEVEPIEFAMTWRGRAATSRPLPARVARALWKRVDWPPIEWWTGPVEVVHGTNYVAPPTRRAASLASVHDLTAVHFPHLCSPDTLDYPVLIRRALDRGAHIHCDSQFVADEVVEWSGCDPAVVHRIYPGIPALSPSPASGESDPPLAGRPYVLVLGTVEPRKDHATVLAAFASVAAADPDLLLVVAGADGWGPSFGSMTAALPEAVRTRIVRESSVDDNRRAALVRHARVLAYPSLYEGFGFPPLEAMHVGVPVLATAVGSLPEVLGEGAVFVSPRESDAMSIQILRMHTDDQLREDLIGRGHRRAEAFGWDRCATEMAVLYRTLAEAGR